MSTSETQTSPLHLKGSSEKLAFKFENSSHLEGWKKNDIPGWPDRWHELAFDSEENQSFMVIKPHVSSWYEDVYGGLLYKEISGDFQATAHVKASGVNNATPNQSFSLGGLMVRKPSHFEASTWQPGHENWLFLSTGTADRPGNHQFEVKTTYQSISTLRTYPAKPEWVQLRIVRLRELFTMLYKYEGEDWQYLDQWVRPDLPETLQVGLIAYTDWDNTAPLYPDFETINKKGIPNGVEDLIFKVQSVSFEYPKAERFGTALTDFASLGEEKLETFMH
ncbi:MAG: hypothetical protein AAFX87_27375 [Bacteroidota bacterium]